MEEYLLTNEANIGPKIITRFSPPTEWDCLPRGSLISVITPDPFTEELWIQRSSIPDQPLWEKI